MTDERMRKFAEAIAEDLLTNSLGEVGDRLEVRTFDWIFLGFMTREIAIERITAVLSAVEGSK